MRDIRDVYQRWLDGELSQEDTLFAIGDLLERDGAGSDAAELTGDRRQAMGHKGP